MDVNFDRLLERCLEFDSHCSLPLVKKKKQRKIVFFHITMDSTGTIALHSFSNFYCITC